MVRILVGGIVNDEEEKNSFKDKPEPKFAIKRTLGLFAVSLLIMGVASCFINKPQSVPVKSTQKSVEWAAKINQMNSEVGKSVQLLWNMLDRRQEDLQSAAEELSDLLYDNAERQRDFCAQESITLLSRYQAINARYTLDIANQIRLINDLINKSDSPILAQSFNEFVGELGCENYTTEQIYIIKNVLKMEADYKETLAKLATSSTLLEIRQNVKFAMQAIAEMRRNGYAQTFLELGMLQQGLAPSVEVALENFIQGMHAVDDASLSAETHALLETILDDAALQEDSKIYWLKQFQKLTQVREQLKRQLQEPLEQKAYMATSQTA
jgi:hypothetical protein